MLTVVLAIIQASFPWSSCHQEELLFWTSCSAAHPLADLFFPSWNSLCSWLWVATVFWISSHLAGHPFLVWFLLPCLPLKFGDSRGLVPGPLTFSSRVSMALTTGSTPGTLSYFSSLETYNPHLPAISTWCLKGILKSTLWFLIPFLSQASLLSKMVLSSIQLLKPQDSACLWFLSPSPPVLVISCYGTHCSPNLVA